MVGFTNADHYYAGMFWTETIDFALRTTFGRQHHMINASGCGDNAANMLSRLERDVLFYQPHLVFLLVGGAEPMTLPQEEFDQSLRAIFRSLQDNGAAVVLMTYYGLDTPKVDPARMALIERNIDCVRTLAAETDTALYDPMRSWEQLRLHTPELFASLLHDPLHVNARGNLLYGMELARALGADLEKINSPGDWNEVRAILNTLDSLS